MADVIPAGPLAVAIDALRTAIANVGWFMTWTGTATPTLALARIFVGEAGFPVAAVAVAANVLTVRLRDLIVIENFVGAVVTLEGASLGSQGGLDLAGPLTVSDQTNNVLSFALVGSDVPEFAPDFAFMIPCPRPLMVLCEADGAGAGRSSAIGTGGTAVFAGEIEILLEADVPAGDFFNPSRTNDAKNALTQARCDMGNFQQGLMALQDTGDFMPLTEFTWVLGPEFVSRPENNDNTARFERWRALAKVSWGVNA